MRGLGTMATSEMPPDDAKKGKKYDASVKFTQAFKKKLERVAEDLGLYPGELVEQHMGEFIAQELLRVLEKELAEAKRAQRPKK